jgi:mRNA interferase MazF
MVPTVTTNLQEHYNVAAIATLRRQALFLGATTTNVSHIYPFQVLLPAARCGPLRDSKAQAEQARSVAASRLGHRVGVLPGDLLAQLDAALRRHLGW